MFRTMVMAAQLNDATGGVAEQNRRRKVWRQATCKVEVGWWCSVLLWQRHKKGPEQCRGEGSVGGWWSGGGLDHTSRPMPAKSQQRQNLWMRLYRCCFSWEPREQNNGRRQRGLTPVVGR